MVIFRNKGFQNAEYGFDRSKIFEMSKGSWPSCKEDSEVGLDNRGSSPTKGLRRRRSLVAEDRFERGDELEEREYRPQE